MVDAIICTFATIGFLATIGMGLGIFLSYTTYRDWEDED